MLPFCCLENLPDNTAILTFKRSQLLYDIENICFIEGETLDNSQYKTTQLIQDAGQRGNVDRITRILDLCVDHCREALYPFSKKDVFIPVRDDMFEEEKEYYIFLSLPTGFSQSTLDYLEKLIHEFIVDTAVADWLSITNPNKMDIWKAKSYDVENKIKSSLLTRTGRLRRPLHPF